MYLSNKKKRTILIFYHINTLASLSDNFVNKNKLLSFAHELSKSVHIKIMVSVPFQFIHL